MKCPCEECISLAICNGIIKSMENPDITRFTIKKKCRDLTDFLNIYEQALTKGFPEGSSRLEYKKKVNKARVIFKLELLSLTEEEIYD